MMAWVIEDAASPPAMPLLLQVGGGGHDLWSESRTDALSFPTQEAAQTHVDLRMPYYPVRLREMVG